jgi:hypothetical protein
LESPTEAPVTTDAGGGSQQPSVVSGGS